MTKIKVLPVIRGEKRWHPTRLEHPRKTGSRPNIINTSTRVTTVASGASIEQAIFNAVAGMTDPQGHHRKPEFRDV
jgi:hypothetical protein